MLFRRQVFITDRAVPLYSREESTERLSVQPFLFEPSSLTLTISFTHRPIVSERVIKLGVSMSGTVLYETWLKTGDGTRKPLLQGTTLILRRSVGGGFILIHCLRWVGDHELGVRTLFVCKAPRYNSESW